VITVPRHTVNGVELYFEQHGQGAALVYVHGGFASLGRKLQRPSVDRPATWRNDFTAQYSLLSYDRRGCDRSSCPPNGYDLPTQADDLAALVDHLQLDAVHLFASSAGGPIAILYAARHPARVRSLTIQGSSLAILNPGDGVREPALAAYWVLQEDGPAAAFDARPAGVEVWFESPWARHEAAEEGRLSAYLLEESELTKRAASVPVTTRIRYYAAEVRNIHAYHDLDMRPHAAALRTPTLVLHGARDRVFAPSAGRQLAAAIPHAQFELIDDAGHGPVFTSAIARQQAVEFLKSHE
jgi:pimeloyl-ACP methyl ester carboxylesterase